MIKRQLYAKTWMYNSEGKKGFAKSKGICPKCEGKGTVGVYYPGMFEGYLDIEECPLCKGMGEIY